MANYKQYLPVLIFLTLLVLSIFVLKSLLITLFMSAILAYSVYPLYHRVKKRMGNETLAAALLCLLVLIVLIVPCIFLIKGLVHESYSLYLFVKENVSPQLSDDCQAFLCRTGRNVLQNEVIVNQIQEFGSVITTWIVARGSAILVSIPRLLLHLFIIFFTLFYFLKDGKALVQSAWRYLQIQKKDYFHVLSRLKEILHGVIYGYLFIALIQGALGALGFFLFGLSSPLFWGLVMAFLSLIPYLGTGLIWLPAAIFIIGEGIFYNSTGLVVKGAGLILYGIVIISSADNVLRPKLMSSKAHIHPLVMFIGILGGALTFGAVGVLLGPLLLSVTVVIMDIFLSSKSA